MASSIGTEFRVSSFQRVSCRVPTDKVCHPSGFAPLLSKQDKMTTHLNDCRCLYIPPPSVPGHTLPLSLHLEPSDAAMSVYLLLVNPSGRLPHTCDGQGTHVNRPIDVVGEFVESQGCSGPSPQRVGQGMVGDRAVGRRHDKAGWSVVLQR